MTRNWGQIHRRAAIEHQRLLRDRRPRMTVEKLAAGSLDVRELHRAGALDGSWVSFPWATFRWPGVKKMRAARYLILLELENQAIPQQVRVS